MAAAHNGHAAVARLLLDAGADLGKADASGAVAYGMSQWQGDLALEPLGHIRMLKKKWANLFPGSARLPGDYG